MASSPPGPSVRDTPAVHEGVDDRHVDLVEEGANVLVRPLHFGESGFCDVREHVSCEAETMGPVFRRYVGEDANGGSVQAQMVDHVARSQAVSEEIVGGVVGLSKVEDREAFERFFILQRVVFAPPPHDEVLDRVVVVRWSALCLFFFLLLDVVRQRGAAAVQGGGDFFFFGVDEGDTEAMSAAQFLFAGGEEGEHRH